MSHSSRTTPLSHSISAAIGALVASVVATLAPWSGSASEEPTSLTVNHLVVQDARGAVLFEAGGPDAPGAVTTDALRTREVVLVDAKGEARGRLSARAGEGVLEFMRADGSRSLSLGAGWYGHGQTMLYMEGTNRSSEIELVAGAGDTNLTMNGYGQIEGPGRSDEDEERRGSIWIHSAPGTSHVMLGKGSSVGSGIRFDSDGTRSQGSLRLDQRRLLKLDAPEVGEFWTTDTYFSVQPGQKRDLPESAIERR